ncbi:hypothetical protein QL285_053756 [Trifolium repens]|nr:hypothetical protein QL285_053756 [Trifolium repens]
MKGNQKVSDLCREVKEQFEWVWDTLEIYGYKVELKLYKAMDRSNSYNHGLSNVDAVTVIEGTIKNDLDDVDFEFSVFNDFVRIPVEGNYDEKVEDLLDKKMKIILTVFGFKSMKRIHVSQNNKLLDLKDNLGSVPRVLLIYIREVVEAAPRA